MTVRRTFVILFVVGLVAAACTGGDADTTPNQSGPQEDVTLNFWTFEEGRDSPYHKALVEAFEAEHPNIHIDFTYYPSSNYDVKVNTAIAAGKAPDLILAFSLNYLTQGLLLPLDDIVAREGIDLDNFNQGIIRGPGEFSCSWEGTLYCLASNQGGWGIFYNKDMFDAAGVPYPAAWPPMTVEQFADDACRLTDASKGVWGAAVPSSVLPFELYVSPDGRTAEGYMNGPEAVHEFDVLSGIVRDGCSPTENVVDPWDQAADYFTTKNLAMAVADFDSAKQFEHAGIDYGVTGPPTPPGVEPFFDVYGDNTAVLASSEHPEEAKEFVAFLATRGEQISFDTEGSIPIDNTIAEQVDWAQGIPGREDILEVLSHARPPVFIPNKFDAFGPFFDAWGYILDGDKTVQEAMDDAAAATQDNLDHEWENWDDQHS
jgi:multiple sugar transport system substrate-binding protein